LTSQHKQNMFHWTMRFSRCLPGSESVIYYVHNCWARTNGQGGMQTRHRQRALSVESIIIIYHSLNLITLRFLLKYQQIVQQFFWIELPCRKIKEHCISTTISSTVKWNSWLCYTGILINSLDNKWTNKFFVASDQLLDTLDVIFQLRIAKYKWNILSLFDNWIPFGRA
jgi:hypothetical protein